MGAAKEKELKQEDRMRERQFSTLLPRSLRLLGHSIQFLSPAMPPYINIPGTIIHNFTIIDQPSL